MNFDLETLEDEYCDGCIYLEDLSDKFRCQKYYGFSEGTDSKKVLRQNACLRNDTKKLKKNPVEMLDMLEKCEKLIQESIRIIEEEKRLLEEDGK